MLLVLSGKAHFGIGGSDQNDASAGLFDDIHQSQFLEVGQCLVLGGKGLIRIHHQVGIDAHGRVDTVHISAAVYVGGVARIVVHHGMGHVLALRIEGLHSGRCIGPRLGHGFKGGFVSQGCDIVQGQRVAKETCR